MQSGLLRGSGEDGRGHSRWAAGGSHLWAAPQPLPFPCCSGWLRTPSALLYGWARQLGEAAEPLGVVSTACPPETLHLVERGLLAGGDCGSDLTHPYGFRPSQANRTQSTGLSSGMNPQ